MIRITSFIFILIIAVSLGCKEKQSVLRITDRNLVDSVYMLMIDSVRNVQDSFCLQLQKDMYDTMVDSIIEVRIREIETLHDI